MKRDSKIISRLQFLRLLGAGAIGYITYRVGFINNLFENARAAATTAVRVLNATSQRYTAGWLSVVATAGSLDEDGILMMAKPKPDGYTYRFVRK